MFFNFEESTRKGRNFFRCWTRKEAFLKAKGIGLAVDLANISVNLDEIAVTLDWLKISTVEQTELLNWKLFPLSIDNLYTAAVVATSFQKNLFTYDTQFFIKTLNGISGFQKKNIVVY
ncbi:4'-phosphopantetheinyl transferase superfamily protein [Rickettsiella massiliensis]|uniref:4'-phosphopantetheinyl transferase superfamily protein n=1 Tax=Rickettsiella massiliensis TaxID=676517 RepID=UPI0009FC6815|nr:4'-phosphopantetheinyl transferase superfamily protein [Rickettsiella massiliensis]